MRTLLILIFLLFSTSFGDVANEYKLKAIFIKRFCHFIESDAFEKNSPNPIKFGVVGDNKVYKQLKDFYSSTLVENKKIKLIHVSSAKQLKELDILFITDTSSIRDRELQENLDSNALVISDKPGYNDSENVITFVVINKKLRFRINVDNAKKRELKISSYLIEMADSIISKNYDGGTK